MKKAKTIETPRDLLLPYQRRWVDDASRFKMGIWSRQTGKDFSAGEEGIRDCWQHELAGTKTTWLIGAAGERQALESLEKWKEWAAAYKLSLADVIEERDKSEALMKSATIVFPHGSRVMAVPASPNTVRGFSANILMTEFAFIEDPDGTWRAIVPSITNPLRGGLKKIRIITTPNGIGNKTHDLWQKNYEVDGAKWSCHRVTIHDAVAQGLPVDIEELKSALDDPEGWAQEFECEFMDTASVLLPYDLIVPCENPLATDAVGPEFWQSQLPEPLFCGIDFGRKRDLTVCWTLARLGGAYHLTKEVLCLAKMSTDQQVEILLPRVHKAALTCLDYTGPGVGLGDYLAKSCGTWDPAKHLYGKIELCTFSNGLKLEIFPKARMAFDQKRIGIPAKREIREDLHSMNRIALKGGGITYRAPHTDDGHADRLTALALAIRAAESGGMISFPPVPFTRGSGRSAARSERCVEA